MRCDVCGYESRNPAKFAPSRRRRLCSRCKAAAQLAWRSKQIRSVMLAAKSRPCIDCGRQLEPERMHLDPRPKLSGRGRPGPHRTIAAFLRDVKERWDVRCEPCHLARHGRDEA